MSRRILKRDTELSGRPQVRKQLLETFNDVQSGFQDQHERSDAILDNWDLYNQVLGDKQFYNGESKLFMPYIHDAMEARKTRFTNQIFPDNRRYVEVTSTDEDLPQATTSLLDHYVRKAQIQTKIMPALCLNGDAEGQYSIYVSWKTETRRVVTRKQVSDVVLAGQMEMPDLGTHEELAEEEIKIGRPDVEVLHDSDLLILPVSANSVDDAIDDGGSVTVIRRWTKARIRKAIRDGEIVSDQGDLLLKAMSDAKRDRYRSPSVSLADAAGIKDRGKVALIYETWTRIRIDGDERLVVAFYGGDDNILGARPCPYWCDRAPVLSVPVKKQAGVAKGKPPVDHVADLQILANDTINEGADTAHYSAMPIVMTDPEKNPKVSSMVLGLAAVWETSPQDTQFAEFPELWANSMGRAAAIQQQIFQTLGVNTSMVPQGGGSDGKMSQAEIAQEQQVDVMTTADAVTVLEEGILTPMVERFAWYDHQFREDAATIRVFGDLGVRARMEDVPSIQLGERWEFTWFGVEQARDAARLQQQIAGMNVIKGVPPQMYPEYELDLSPLMTRMAETIFGPELAPLIFKRRSAITVDPHLEDEMMENGFRAAVHDADDDMAHLMVHVATLKDMGGVDPHGALREHIQMHQAQLLAKQSSQQLQGQQGGTPGSPGGAGQPGAAGTPAPGGQVEGPRMMKGPPGMIHPDEMTAAGATPMPRNM